MVYSTRRDGLTSSKREREKKLYVAGTKQNDSIVERRDEAIERTIDAVYALNDISSPSTLVLWSRFPWLFIVSSEKSTDPTVKPIGGKRILMLVAFGKVNVYVPFDCNCR